MPYDPHAAVRRVRGLPNRLNNLAEHLRVLSARVRESVTEAIGDTLSCTVKDALSRAWSGQRVLDAPMRQAPSQRDRNDWYDDRENDPWGQEPGPWDEPASYSRQAPTESDRAVPKSSAFALAMQMAGWWMYRRGTLYGAVGLGLAVGGMALIGGRVARTGLGLIESASAVFALNNSLASGAVALTDV